MAYMDEKKADLAEFQHPQRLRWGHRELSDGRTIPEIAWGSWKQAKETVAQQVVQAIDTGFTHIDTAQTYRNEEEVGEGIKDSLEKRKDVWITSKWSGFWSGDKGIEQSCHETLQYLGIKALDLYLIHAPELCKGDILGCWKTMLRLKKEGHCKSVGVSNFEIRHLEEIRKAGLEMPVINQIYLQPYVYFKQAKLLAYHEQHEIVTEAYSVLMPLTGETGGPLDPVLARICDYRGTTPDQVLLAWARSKRAVVITTSRSKFRLLGYLAAGSLHLTDQEIVDIDVAAARPRGLRRVLKLAAPALLATAGFVALEYVRQTLH